MTDFVAADVAKATVDQTDILSVALHEAIVRGEYVEDETSLDGDGDVVLVNPQPGAWYVGATFTDGDETVFVNVTPDGPLSEEHARARFYENSKRYADDQYGGLDAYNDWLDAAVDAYIEEQRLARA